MPKWLYSSISNSPCSMARRIPVQWADTGIAEPTEDQLSGAAGSDELFVHEVWSESRKGQVSSSLADDLMAGGEADEVSEALDGNQVPIVDVCTDCLSERNDFRHPLKRSGPPS